MTATHPLAAAVLQQEAGEPVAWEANILGQWTSTQYPDDMRAKGYAVRRQEAAQVEPVATLTMVDGTPFADYLANAISETEDMDDWTRGYEECKRRLHRIIGPQLATPPVQQAAPKAVPLAEEQIMQLNREAQDQGISGIPPVLHLARAIERAHGIGLETKGDGNG